jgi:hypothetical protein
MKIIYLLPCLFIIGCAEARAEEAYVAPANVPSTAPTVVQPRVIIRDELLPNPYRYDLERYHRQEHRDRRKE